MGLPDPLHPAVVHFPIALAFAAALVEAAARRSRWSSLAPAGALLIVLAAAGAIAAVVTGGWASAEAVVPASIVEHLEAHEELGETTMWVLLALAVVRIGLAWWRRLGGWRAWAYLAVLLAALTLVVRTGQLGGELVFRHGVGTDLMQRAPAAALSPPPAVP